MTVCTQANPSPTSLHDSDPLRRNPPSHGIGLKLFIAACFASALFGRLCFLFQPFNSDGAMFVYMGKLVSHGGRIGYELIDNKFPTDGLLTSLPWRIFGAWWPGYVLLQTALGLIGPCLLARAVWRNLGQHAAIATGAFALVFFNFKLAVFGAFQLETIQAFFAIIAGAAALSAICRDDPRDSFLLGLAAGMAAMVKPSGLAVLPAFAVAILWRQRRHWLRAAAHATASALGLAIPLAATLLYLSSADLLREMPEITRQIANYASHSSWEAWDWSKPIVVVVLLGFPMLVRGPILRRDHNRLDQPSDPALLLFALLWLAIETAGVVAQRRMYAYHFLVLAPPAALLFGLIPRRTTAWTLAAALTLPMLPSLYGAMLTLQNPHSPVERLPVSDYLQAHAQPGDAVWEDGMMRLLVETNLQPGSRYPLTFLWVNEDDAPLRYCHEMLSDFNQRRPQFILLSTPIEQHIQIMSTHIKELWLSPARQANYVQAWEELRQYVEMNYRPEAVVGDEIVYRRLSPADQKPK